jgi:hypothetical protein
MPRRLSLAAGLVTAVNLLALIRPAQDSAVAVREIWHTRDVDEAIPVKTDRGLSCLLEVVSAPSGV